MTLEDRYVGSIKLLAIADALGWITEGKKTKQEVKAGYGVENIDRFYNWKGRHSRFNDSLGKVSSGSYSDMTQLLLTTARSIKPGGTCDHEYFAKQELSAWTLYKQGAGRTTSTAALNISRNTAKWNNNFFVVQQKHRDYRDCGANGAAMRILPIALANAGNFLEMKESIFVNSIVTHGHPRALISALMYGYLIDNVLSADASIFKWPEMLKELKTGFRRKFELPFLNNPDYKEWLGKWNDNKQKIDFIKLYEEILSETIGKVEIVLHSLSKNIDCKQTFIDLGCFEKGKKHYGTSTLLAGLFIFCKYIDHPVDGILKAVNMLGSDTKTIAVFAAGLFGALYGTSIIPSHWHRVQDAKYLEEISKKLYRISRGEKVELHKRQTNNQRLKDLSQIRDDKYSIGETVFYNPLGKGKINSVIIKPSGWGGGIKNRLYLGVCFDIGQSCIFTKLVDKN